MISVRKLNDVHIKVDCDASTAYELNEHFTFNVPGAKFSPAFKNKLWDGKIRLFHLMRRTLYAGLVDRVKQFAGERDYTFEVETPNDFAEDPFTKADAEHFARSLKLPLAPRDYQLDAFIHCIRNRRAVLLSPTASGKSLVIYMLAQYWRTQKVLIVVPTIGLVHQLASNFIDEYGCDSNLVHKIFSGQEKITDAAFVITTWQSIYQLSPKWFQQFGAVIGDEAHQFKAKSLVGIMENLVQCPYRVGLTGTLDGSNTNKLVLEGLFGPTYTVTTTQELMQEKTLAQLKIKSIVLSYEDSFRQLCAKNRIDYKTELRLITQHKARTNFIANLTLSLENNSLLLFNFIDHGKMLQSAIQSKDPQRQVFFVYGGVEGEEREAIRHYVENNDKVIVIASYKTFSTGVNIKNLHNIVFGSPSKSRIRVFQSIGRGLRVNDDKDKAILYDIADDFSWKSYKNITLQHFSERMRMYNEERFEYKIYNVQLKGSA